MEEIGGQSERGKARKRKKGREKGEKKREFGYEQWGRKNHRKEGGKNKSRREGQQRAEWVEGLSPAPPTHSADGKPDTAGHCVLLLKNNQTVLLK